MPQAAIKDRSPYSPSYQRHRPEQTLLYQIIERHYLRGRSRIDDGVICKKGTLGYF